MKGNKRSKVAGHLSLDLLEVRTENCVRANTPASGARLAADLLQAICLHKLRLPSRRRFLFACD